MKAKLIFIGIFFFEKPKYQIQEIVIFQLHKYPIWGKNLQSKACKLEGIDTIGTMHKTVYTANIYGS